jgi:hypothetical protein
VRSCFHLQLTRQNPGLAACFCQLGDVAGQFFSQDLEDARRAKATLAAAHIGPGPALDTVERPGSDRAADCSPDLGFRDLFAAADHPAHRRIKGDRSRQLSQMGWVSQQMEREIRQGWGRRLEIRFEPEARIRSDLLCQSMAMAGAAVSPGDSIPAAR